MSLLQKLIGAALRPVVRRQARGLGYEEMHQRLRDSGKSVQQRFQAARDTGANREAMNHIIGIERWGHSRLRVALGEVLEMDGYRKYRMDETASLATLQEAFRETRRTTIELVAALRDMGLPPETTVKHNDLGDLTLAEWLVYLDGHAKREMLRIRTR